MSEQLMLNYVEITDVANRTYLREQFRRTDKTAYKIPIKDIQVREGFNKRIVYEGIDELAASIKAHGLREPLTVDVLKDGTIYVEKGHRRLKAFDLLIEQGESIDTVDCYVNDSSVDEFDRMLDQYTSNNFQKKLLFFEVAEVVLALKNNFSKVSNEVIAEKMNCSRQQIDNYLVIANASDDIKNQIRTQNLGFKESLDLIRNEKKLKAMSDKAEEKAGQSSMYVQPDPFDPNADELKELEAVEKQAAEIRMTNNLSGEDKESGQPLDLVGNTVHEKLEAKEKGEKKYDEDRPEIAQIQNIVKLIDKADVICEKIPDKQTSKDLCDILKWMRNDALYLRDWIHSNKKQNKIR